MFLLFLLLMLFLLSFFPTFHAQPLKPQKRDEKSLPSVKKEQPRSHSRLIESKGWAHWSSQGVEGIGKRRWKKDRGRKRKKKKLIVVRPRARLMGEKEAKKRVLEPTVMSSLSLSLEGLSEPRPWVDNLRFLHDGTFPNELKKKEEETRETNQKRKRVLFKGKPFECPFGWRPCWDRSTRWGPSRPSSYRIGARKRPI